MFRSVLQAPAPILAAAGSPSDWPRALNHSTISSRPVGTTEGLAAQSTLLRRDLTWDDQTHVTTLPMALHKRHIASSFEDMDMPARMRGALGQLIKDADFTRHPDELYQRGFERLRQLVQLGSPLSGHNALYEYLTYQVLAMITTLKEVQLFEDFVAFLAAPYSLDALADFCRQHQILNMFDLKADDYGQTIEVRQVLDYIDEVKLSAAMPADMMEDFKGALAALSALKARARYSAGIEQDLKELSPQRFAKLIHLCLFDGSRKAWLEAGFKYLRGRPFRLPLTLRLLQNIAQEASLHKVVELLTFPWDASAKIALDTFTCLDPHDIAGTIHTAYNYHSGLVQGLHYQLSIRDRVDAATLSNRRSRMDELIHRRPNLFRSVSEQSIAMLLRLQPTETSWALADRIERKGIEIIPLSEPELEALNAARKQQNPNDTGTHASFRVSNDTGEKPALLLPEFGGRFSVQEVAFMAHHEGIHLQQAEQYGLHWISENLITAEMEAWSWDLAFRLINGENGFIQRFAQLSPFSFALGLQNGL
ncbi:MAG: hypothetical protein R3245_08915, partial [Kiloniellales bacterium]|nr:hypothetical protein [Kiloniellales bacterium]